MYMYMHKCYGKNRKRVNGSFSYVEMYCIMSGELRFGGG